MNLVGLVRKQTEDSSIPFSDSEVKTVTRGNPYKFALLNHPKSCLKKVFRVKSVYLKIYSSKLSETSWTS